MKALGIAKVFDLRSDVEIHKYKSYQLPIDGIDIIKAPVFQMEDYSPETMAKYVRANHPCWLMTHRLIWNYLSRRYQLYASGKTEVCSHGFSHGILTFPRHLRLSWNFILKS